MNLAIEIIGWLASIMTICMYTPQSLKVLISKKTEGLSKTTYCLVICGSISWTIFATLIHSWQAWTANAIVILAMIPVVYYLFKNDLRLVVLISSIILAASITTFILMFIPIGAHPILATVFSIAAGIGTGLPFVPQVVKTFKSKDVASIAILTSVGVVIANILWVLYYGLMMKQEGFLPENFMAVLFCAFAVITSSIMIFIYFRYKGKTNVKK